MVYAGSDAPAEAAAAPSENTCPLLDTSAEFETLRTEAVSSLTVVKNAADQCLRDFNTASGGTNPLDQAITQLGQARREPCLTAAQRIEQRSRNLASTVQAYRGTPVPDAASVSTPQVSQRGQDSWVRITHYASFISGFDAYQSKGCVVNGGEDSGLYVFYVNLTCAQVSDDVDLALVSSSATPDQSCSSDGAALSAQTTQALQTAFDTLSGILNGSRNSNCQAAPQATASVLNLGLSLAMSSPISPLIGVLARAGQQLFNGIFGRQLRTADAAISRINRDRAERQAQCLYMNLQKTAYGCDSMPANLAQLEARVNQKRDLEGQLERAIAGYRSAYSNADPDADNRRCVTESTNQVSDLVSGLNLGPLESLLQPEVRVETASAPPAPTAVNLDAVIDALGVSCNAFNGSRDRLLAIEPIRDLMGRLQRSCDLRRTLQTPQELKAVLFNGNRSLSRDLSIALEDVPQVQGRPEDRLLTCLGALGPERRSAILNIRNLRGQLSTYANADEEYRTAQAGTDQGLQRTEARTVLASYHASWVGNNGTNFSIGDILQDRVERGSPVNLRQACASGYDSTALVQVSNEIHATCLLNAGAYLNNNQDQGEYDSRRANYWREKCGVFLSSTDLAPARAPASSATMGQFEVWQCQAIANYEDYHRNFMTNRNQVMNSLCRSIGVTPPGEVTGGQRAVGAE